MSSLLFNALRITCPLCHGYGDTTTANARRPVVCSLCAGSGHIYARPAPGTPAPREHPPLFPLTRGDPYPATQPDRLALPGREDGVADLASTRARGRELPLDRLRRRHRRYEKLAKLRESHDEL